MQPRPPDVTNWHRHRSMMSHGTSRRNIHETTSHVTPVIPLQYFYGSYPLVFEHMENHHARTSSNYRTISGPCSAKCSIANSQITRGYFGGASQLVNGL